MKKFDYDDFAVICNRVFKELSIDKDKQLVDILGVSQPTFSRKKSENTFDIEWAYFISRKYGLLTEWVLTGRGPKTLGTSTDDDFFVELERWGKDVSKSDNIDWMKTQIDQTFPMFKAWRKRKEDEKVSKAVCPDTKVA